MRFNLEFRLEETSDQRAIYQVHQTAFPTEAEARLVDALREAGRLTVSLVAAVEGEIVGHVAFSPVTVDGVECGGLGLAPVAVRPEWQRRGIGARLIESGIAVCRACGHRFVVVLGEPAYYARFGFTRADVVGLANEYGAGPEFMVLNLGNEGPLPTGLVRYAPEFSVVS